MNQLEENIREVEASIATAAARFGHSPTDITFIAVTKTVEEDIIREAIGFGIQHVGENRVQEMIRKHDAFAGAHLHLIGQLQTNKVRQIPRDTVLVQSVDRLSLLKEMERIGIRDDRDFEALIEVNTGESQKGGCDPSEVPVLLQEADALTRVRIRGLMCVAPFTENPEDVRSVFRNMRTLFDKMRAVGYNRNKLDYLSMGMTHDFTVALEEGANMIRVGTALFGQRKG